MSDSSDADASDCTQCIMRVLMCSGCCFKSRVNRMTKTECVWFQAHGLPIRFMVTSSHSCDVIIFRRDVRVINFFNVNC